MSKLYARKLTLLSGLAILTVSPSWAAVDADSKTQDAGQVTANSTAVNQGQANPVDKPAAKINGQVPAANQATAGANQLSTTSADTKGQATSSAANSDGSVPGKQTTAAGSQAADGANQSAPVHIHAGQELTVGTDSDGLVTTYDVELAKKQVATYPTNPEAHFILAVALTRTSYVEEALQEVRRARHMAQTQGGAKYFDKMIAEDEKLLTYSAKDNRVRYNLAWAYYMKAYLLAQESSRNAPPQPANAKSQIAVPDAALALAATLGIKAPKTIAPIQGAMDKATAAVQPQVKKYYELALSKLDELLKQEPGDMWARVYRAHLKAEYTGNLDEAMATWRECQKDAPDNPASYFFLGEGYLKQGNLKESLGYISRAIALRAQGK